MFDFFRKHTRFLQFVLVLLVFPSFVFFGIQGYSRFTGGSNTTVAKVAGQGITQAEWEAAHRSQVERLRRQMPGVDAKLLDSPQMKRQSLDALVRERVMLAAVDKFHLVTTDDRLVRLFSTDPQFAFARNPDGTVNKDVLQAQGMSSDMFAQRLRQDFSMRQVLQGLSDTAFAPSSVAATSLDAFFQQRAVQIERFDSKEYAAKIDPSDVDLERYYHDPANAAQFQAPESVDVEYVLLDLDTLKKSVKVSDEELRKYYAENAQRFTTPQERRARHILIKAEKGDTAADRAKAKAKAEALLAELKKNPAAFPELARKNSDDPVSAARGGDLDFFGRGAMVKPFEDAVFALKPGEISGLVETDFGYHIIQLEAVRGGATRSFEEVRPEVDNEVRQQLAQKKFAEAAVDFTNMVYEQSYSLKPVVDKFKLELRTGQGVRRTPAPDAVWPLSNPKFVEALFATDALRNKRNTDAVEIGPNQLVSGRVLQYSPAHTQPFDQVRVQVRQKVIQQQASALAHHEGAARLAALKKDPQAALAVPVQKVSRLQARDMPRPMLDAILSADASTLPAVVGVDLGPQGYAVVRIDKIVGRDPIAADSTGARAQYAKAWGDAEAQAYYAALKKRFKVEVNERAVAGESAASAASK